MRSVSRYIFNQLLTITIFVTLGLTFAVWLTQSLRLIDYIVNRGLPATTFLAFAGLLLPSFIGVVLPIASFCAVLFIYNKMMLDSEVVVLRAAGLSQLQLAAPAFTLMVAVVAVAYSISLYFLPVSYSAFKELQNELRNDYSTVLLQEGVFNTVSDGITVYVRERSADGELRGILVHDNRDRKRPVTMMAERGALVTSEQGPRVVMVNGNRQEVEEGTGRLSLLYFDSYTVELTKLQNTLRDRWREPKERFLSELLNPDNSEDDQRFRGELISEGHQRIVAPIYSASFILLALGVLLSGEFNRRGQLRRVILAVLCVAALEGMSLALQDLASRSLQAIPAMYAGPIVPILVSFYLLLRRPRRRATALAMGAPAQ